MKTLIPHIAAATLILATPGTAQDTISPDESGGFLVDFLEENLSGENRFVEVQGLSGTFSSKAEIARLTISDSDGIWLELEGAELDWNRTALLRGALSVNRLSAERIAVTRAPLPDPQQADLPNPEATPLRLPELPISITLNEIAAERIELGAELLGQDSVWSVKGKLALEGGELDSALSLNRLDRVGDSLNLGVSFTNTDQFLALNLAAQEAPGGLISASLPIQDPVPLSLSVAGEGPIESFAAEIAFQAGTHAQISGDININAAGGDSETPQGLIFSSDLNGDFDALLPSQYRAFFGPDLRLRLKGETFSPNGLALHSLAINSRALRLAGSATLQQGQLNSANLRASISPPEGQARITLPVSGGNTSVAQLDLQAKKTSGPDWDLSAILKGLETADLALEHAKLDISGDLAQAPLDLDGKVFAQISGLILNDAGLAEAIGRDVQLNADLKAKDQQLALHNLQLVGKAYRADGQLGFASWSEGLRVTSDLTAELSDLSVLSKLTGQSLAGRAAASVEGSFTPLSGAFHANLHLTGDDLAIGTPQIDQLIAGQSKVHLNAKRDPSGLTVERFTLNSAGLRADAAGSLNSNDGVLTLAAELADIATFIPQNSGPLQLNGEIKRNGQTFDGTLTLNGPHSSSATLNGTAGTNGNADLKFEAHLGQLERFVAELTGALSAQGQANRKDGVWRIQADATGPAGISANVNGQWDEATAQADLNARGNLRLDVANPFIAPNLLTGDARFDIALNGTPNLDALSGTITTSAGRLALPTAGQQIEAITSQIRIARSRADISLNARPRDGGRLALRGPVTLTPPFASDLSITLDQVKLTDNLLYRTILDGNLQLSGPLTEGGRLSGRIEVGETNINLASAGGAIDAAPIPEIRHIGESRAVRQTRARAGLIGQASSGSQSPLALDLTIDAPNRIFARGRGLRAELGGQITVRGTASAPEPAGQIGLIRGSFDILGRRLSLDDGQITLLGSLTPYLNFTASTNTSEGSATLNISGPLDAPQIEVTSEPNRPSEEALALLLFGDNVQDLSPLALARLATSAAKLSGRGIGAEEKLADETGADDVDIGFDNLGVGELGIGGYVSQNVYTDFNVNTRGDSELSINLDLNEKLSVTGTVDSAGETGLGLFFKRDY